MVKDERGSVTIEAVIILPIFILFLLGFTYLIKYVYASELMDFALKNTSTRIATEFYLLEKTDITYEIENMDLKNELINFPKIIEESLVKEYITGYINSQASFSSITKSLELKNSKILVDTDYREEDILIGVSSNYNMPFKFKFYSNIEKEDRAVARKLLNGDSLKDYNIASSIVKAGYDIWGLPNLERGMRIGDILGNNLGYNSYGLDVYDGGRIISIVSIDIRKDSYSSSGNIIRRLTTEVDKLYDFKDGSFENFNISQKDYSKKMLEVVIPVYDVSEDVLDALMDIKRYASTKNIELKITTVIGTEEGGQDAE